MPTITQLLKSKTLIFSVLLAVLSVAQGYIGLFVLDPKSQAAVGVVIAGLVAVLRFLTTQPLDNK